MFTFSMCPENALYSTFVFLFIHIVYVYYTYNNVVIDAVYEWCGRCYSFVVLVINGDDADIYILYHTLDQLKSGLEYINGKAPLYMRCST